MRAFIHVQHLLGTGHTVRACLIGQALARKGVEVTLACGNTPPPTLDCSGLIVHQLPPVRSKTVVFDELIDENGKTIDENWWQRRCKETEELFLSKPFDLLLTETFPFGRRAFTRELTPLLELARTQKKPPLIACSIRDILVRKDKLAKEQWMAEMARRYYDLVLVHSDPSLIELKDSFPFYDEIRSLVSYTGFVSTGRKTNLTTTNERGEIIVSCGGGAVGLHLLENASQAAKLAMNDGLPNWRLLVGHDINEEAFERLKAQATPNTTIERARPDFPALLERAALSISQAGYNTVIDILRANQRCILVPFAQGVESEQTQRACSLEQRGRAIVLEEATLTPEALLSAVKQGLHRSLPNLSVSLDGAKRSADILLNRMEARRFP
ncbi:glycosyltransferase [Rhodobacteraceae bacterium RKSG542]|uniref:glycosyltransferase family protein n=1 Tax=Pseudovibrio flavus TaxID=2529854 RepID=UPI0012BD1480|nr:glycosyltransferase [Pseudovibrio flavus]MTI17027.1 glycosyltransferase [Pseudovibrio flavus]